ncbi:hypothetical protein HU200_038103 [Digitaria exilis]|uniref:Uncharacterized protein n=1 Tax=Digitaria exilis TaxID=1010633 RepID=A0A835BCU9_9POAL|nr:hypothetical protein HU200_038103 [Digitaria exilis]
MKITVHSSKVVKPAAYAGVDAAAAATTTTVIPLTAFDLISYDNYVSSIHAFHPPSPTNAALEDALARVLAVYREWAGRLCVADGRRGILLNDAGVRFVEASSDAAFESAVMPRRGRITPEVRFLHPRAEDEELLLLQVTRFACGSLVVGYTMHHAVGDGFAAGQFMAAWGQTARGVPIDPVPVHDRTSFFLPRTPPRVEFDHRASEFRQRDDVDNNDNHHAAELKDDEVVIQQLRSRASGNGTTQHHHHHRPYSTAQCLVAHIWRWVHGQPRALGAPDRHGGGAPGGAARARGGAHPRGGRPRRQRLLQVLHRLCELGGGGGGRPRAGGCGGARGRGAVP